MAAPVKSLFYSGDWEWLLESGYLLKGDRPERNQDHSGPIIFLSIHQPEGQFCVYWEGHIAEYYIMKDDDEKS